MNPVLKWLGIVVGVVLLMIGASTLLISRLIDEAELKRTLLELANKDLDGTLAIDGELSVSVFPSLALGVSDVRLRAPAGASEDLASIRELRLGMKLMPLLRRQVRIDELVLKGLRVQARRDKNGTANWETKSKESSSAGGTLSASAGVAAAPLLLAIDRVRIEDGTLGYLDEQADTHYELRDIALASDGVNLRGEPFELNVGARLLIGNGERDIRIAFASVVDADHDSGRVVLQKSGLSLTPANGPAIELAAPDITASVDERTATIPALTLSAPTLEATASLMANWSDPDALAVNGKLDIKELQLPVLFAALGITWPVGLNPEPLADIALQTDYALSSDTLALSELKLRAGKFDAEGKLSLGSGKNSRIDAKFSSPELDVGYFFPPAATPPGHAAASAAAPPDAAPPDAAPPDAAPPDAAPGALLSMDGTIEASLGRLVSGKLEMSDIVTRLVLDKDRARLENLSAKFYGGTLRASGALDTREAGAVSLKAEFGAVDLKALLRATQDFERMEGRLDGSFDLAGAGHTLDDWKAALHGPVRFSLKDPVLNGMNVEEVICKAAAQLNQEALGARFDSVTRFQSIDTGLDFDKGIGTLQNFRASVPNIALRGDGTLNLRRGKFDIQLNARVTDDLGKLDPACRMTRKMLAVEWPITCKGDFDEDPKKWCGIDRDDVTKIATQLATDKVKDKLMDKLGDFFKHGN